MFEKFTERARKVMGLARQEAQRLESEFIGTEHILLGLIQEGSGVASKVLKNMNVDLKRIRQEIERLLTTGSAAAQIGQLPFSPRAKRVLELAKEIADEMGHDMVGTEHLLLGLLKENEGIAAQVLTNLGVKPDEVRDMILDIMGAETEQSPVVSDVDDEKPTTKNSKSKTPALDAFGRDLNEMAKAVALAEESDVVLGIEPELANVVSSVFVYAGQSPQFSIQITDGSGSTVSCSSTDPSLVQVGTTIHTDSGVYVTWDANQNCYSLQVLARSAQAPMQP